MLKYANKSFSLMAPMILVVTLAIPVTSNAAWRDNSSQLPGIQSSSEAIKPALIIVGVTVIYYALKHFGSKSKTVNPDKQLQLKKEDAKEKMGAVQESLSDDMNSSNHKEGMRITPVIYISSGARTQNVRAMSSTNREEGRYQPMVGVSIAY